MELINAVMEIMLLEKIMKNPVPMKIMMGLKNNKGKLVELRGVVRRMVVMKQKKIMSQLKKGANDDGDDEELGKENKGNGYGVDERGDGDNGIGDNCEKSSANENNDGGKDQSGKDGGTEGNDKEYGSDEKEKDYESNKDNEANGDGDDDESGKVGGTDGSGKNDSSYEEEKNDESDKKTKQMVKEMMDAVMEIMAMMINMTKNQQKKADIRRNQDLLLTI